MKAISSKLRRTDFSGSAGSIALREKKFFDSYIEYGADDNGGGVAASNGATGARVLSRPNDAAMAPYHEDGAVSVGSYENEGAPARVDPLRRLLDLLWRRRWLVIPIVLGTLLLGLLYSLRARKVYSATATLLVNTTLLSGEKRPEDPNGSTDAPASEVPVVDEARRLETQIEIIKTDGVFQSAAESLDPDDKAAIERFYTLGVGSIRNTNLVTVAVGSPSPQASAALANAIGAAYIELSQKNNRREIQKAADTATKQLGGVRKELTDARDSLKNYQAKVGITDGDEQAKNVAATLEATKTELTAARASQAAAAASLKVQQDVLANTPREIISYTTVTRPTVITLRAELTKLRLDRTAALAEYRPESDVVRNFDQQIARVEAQLAGEPENETLPAQRAPNPAYISASERLAQARSDLQQLRARIPILEANLARAVTAQAQLPAKTAGLSQRANLLAGLQTRYDNIFQQAQDLQLRAESQLSNGVVTSPATPPGAPSGRGRNSTLLMALALGCLLGYLVALLVDRLDEKIHNQAQARSAAHLPILIDVPRINRRRDQSVLTGNAPFLRENFEMLTAQLSLASREIPLRSVLMTSALPDEGKSVSCVNLAVAAAWAGEEVVLIDCDGRSPSLHEYFGLSNDLGFSDVVLGRVSLEEAVQPTRIAGLSVLTAGTPHESPLEILRSLEAQNIIDELSNLADLTIVDSPPTLLIADASVLATMTDATILVVACGEAAKSEITRATNILHQTGARLLGIVLTKVAPKLGERAPHSDYSTHHSTRNLRGPGERKLGSISAGDENYRVAGAGDPITRPFDPDRPYDENGGVR